MSNSLSSFPSYHERRKTSAFVQLTPEAKRIFWKLQGPLSDCVFVVQDWRNLKSPREALVRKDAAGNMAGWHPVADAPLTDPKIGSITVEIDKLEQWEEQWLERHERHADPGDKNCVFGELPEFSGLQPEDDDDDEGPHLLRCCGTDRPVGARPMVIWPLDATKDYVTVHDYISALHPWLMGLRGDFARADNVWDDRKPADYERLVVDYSEPAHLTMMDEERYLASARPGRKLDEWMRQDHQLDPLWTEVRELNPEMKPGMMTLRDGKTIYIADPKDLPQQYKQ